MFMSKIRAGGYVFVTWVADHPPPHVHVYRDNRLVVKWDLESNTPLKGRPNRRILKLIERLRQEGRL
ncbi:MAG: DUF4160 domain-containing protein [Acidobacteria bacterium]|nr:DUF4160 domain-containing protein [Acidobacteriota bacterium]